MSSGSIREAVLLKGVLKGMNLEVPCTVRAVKVCLPDLEILEYVRADIAQAPSELPLGDYDVSFEGETMKVKKTAGGWIAWQV